MLNWSKTEVEHLLFQEKTIMLNNGQQAMLRSPKTEDAEALLAHIKVCCGETEFLLKTPEEYDMSIEDEEHFIDRLNQHPRDMMILCVAEGNIVGTCNISFGSAIKNAHRGTVGIAVREEYWGLGIGSALFDEMIAYGEKMGAYQLELEVMEDNARGISLYEKKGFSTVAKLPNANRQPDGRMVNDYFMVKILS